MTGLDRLLRPRSIAVIGGGFWGRNVLAMCQKFGFAGELWAVHPTASEVEGINAFRSVEDLPAAPDASFIGVNRTATIEIVRTLARLGAGGAVCFASGFREATSELEDGQALEDELLKAAGEFRVLGPNCYGFLNALDRAPLWPDQHGLVPVERGVAIISQSSNIALNLTMQRRGLPLAYVVTVGNQAQTDLAEIGISILEDVRVTALGLYIEGIRDLRAFEALADAAVRLGKSIVALKAGSSEQARRATVSHTASLAGSDAGGAALLERLGIARVTSLGSLLETLKLLHVTTKLASNKIASLSCSGGEAILMADMGTARGLEFPALNKRQCQDLREALGAKVALANPLDYHTYIWGDAEAVTACYAAMADPSLAIMCLILDLPRADRSNAQAWRHAIDSWIEARRRSDIPFAIIASLPETMPEYLSAECLAQGIVPLCGMAEALDAITVGAWLGQIRHRAEPLWLPMTPANPKPISEAKAKQALGSSVPKNIQVLSPKEAANAASSIGFPVVLKGEGFAHKSEAGAVVLNLQTASDVERVAQEMPTSSFLVEAMVADGIAELLLGVVLDPAHGYVLTLAAGGILTELLADRTSLLLPASKNEIATALESLRIYPVIAGYRGKKGANLDAILDAVMIIQAYVGAHRGRVMEIEINPLICRQHDALAVDALIIQGEKLEQ